MADSGPPTWRCENPKPFWYTLYGVWGSADDDVWAVGDAVLHWDGTAWTEDTSPALAGVRLQSVAGSSSNDVWAVGNNGAIVHWNGHEWSHVRSMAHQYLAGVWASSAQDVWVVGYTGVPDEACDTYSEKTSLILHWDGAHWSESSGGIPGALWSVWGSSAIDVWAVGYSSRFQDCYNTDLDDLAFHWDGTAWSTVRNCAIIN